MNLPVNFREKVSASGGSKYPTQISAGDLDKNFAFCDQQFPEVDSQGNPQPWTVDEFTGVSGYKQKRVFFSPAPPQDGGTYVLGFSKGQFVWMATEEC